MEVALEMEDDLFFAELNKRISLLIMEEEDAVEEESVVASHWHHASSLQGFTGAVNNQAAQSLVSVYNQVNCGRENSKGTGVFIPKSSQPRRKNRQGRFSPSSSSRSHRQGSDHRHSSLTIPGPSQSPHKNPFHPKRY